MEQAREIISIFIPNTEPSGYEFELYPGPEGPGTFLFILLLDDVESGAGAQNQQGAFITLNGVFLTQYLISLICQKVLKVETNLIKVNSEAFNGETFFSRAG